MLYIFQDFGGVDNCAKCDAYGEVNEWLRNDGKTFFICRTCRPRRPEAS